MSPMRPSRTAGAALQLAVTAALVGGSLFMYDRFVVRPSLAVGIVDVAEVYRAKEAEFTMLLTRSSSDDDRQRALSMARDFSQRLPIALDELPRDCACLVLVKSAVAGSPQGRDLTPLLRQKVQTP